jgi:hypothetical protein
VIKIVKHKKAEPVCDYGDILYPFKDWEKENVSTGCGYFSKVPKEFYGKKRFFPLSAISLNPWNALDSLKIYHKNISEESRYKCPYSSNYYFHTIPIFLFSEKIDDWIKDTKVFNKKMYLDRKWMKQMYFASLKTFDLSRVHKSFLGHGYEDGLRPCDGDGSLFDALVSLDNGDYLGFKIFVWYNN